MTAIILLATGIVLRYWIARRRFKRRGVGGLQHFSSFGKGLLITIIEYLLVFASWLLIGAGIATILFPSLFIHH